MVKHLPATRETWVRSLGWKIPWRRKWQPTPVFLPGESHGQRSLVGYSPWSRRVRQDWATSLHFTGSLVLLLLSALCLSLLIHPVGVLSPSLVHRMEIRGFDVSPETFCFEPGHDGHHVTECVGFPLHFKEILWHWLAVQWYSSVLTLSTQDGSHRERAPSHEAVSLPCPHSRCQLQVQLVTWASDQLAID